MEKEITGTMLANYVAACQGKEGHHFDSDCKRIQEVLRAGGDITGGQRVMLQACLLQPCLELREIAQRLDGIGNGLHDDSQFEYGLPCEVLEELKSALENKSVSVSSGEVKTWLEFCAIRSKHFTYQGSSEYFSYLHEPIFAEIDDALEEHRLFSALIYGPKNWANKDQISEQVDVHFKKSKVTARITGDSFASRAARYIASCQGRKGYAFDDECHEIRHFLRRAKHMLFPSEVYLIMSHLLMPECDLTLFAKEMDKAGDVCKQQKKSVFEKYPLQLEETIPKLQSILEHTGIFISNAKAGDWIRFAVSRGCFCANPGSSEEHSSSYDPVFAEIDEVVKEHPLFSALIAGPKDWGKPKYAQ